MPEGKEDISIANLLQAQRELLLGPAVSGQAPPPPTSGSAGIESQEDAFVNLRNYAYLVYSRKWWVILVTLVVATAAFAYAYLRPAVYEATAEVVLRENMISTGGDLLFGGRAVYYDPDALAKLAEMAEVAKLADEELVRGLKRRLESPGTKLTALDRAELQEAIEAPLRAGPVGAAQVGKYTVTLAGRHQGTSRSRSTQIIAQAKAEAQALALVRYFREAVGGGARIKILEALVGSNEEELRRVSARIAEALKKKPEDTLPAGVLNRLDFIQMQKRNLMETDLRITEAGQGIAEIDRFLSDPGKKRPRVSPDLRRQLLRLNTELAQMEERYKAEHPKLVDKKAEIAVLKKFMAEQEGGSEMSIDPRQSSLESERYKAEIELRSQEARKAALAKSIQEATERLSGEGASQAALEYEQSVREQRSLEDMSAHLRRKLREAKLTALTEKGENGRPAKEIIKLGKLGGTRRLGANLYQTVGFAVMLGLVLGVLLALLLEHLDDTVRNELSVRRVADLPVIAKLPRFEGDNEKRFVLSSAPRSTVAETFKVFHNHVRYISASAPEKCLLISSPGSEEGKSYVAVNLALSFASEGNHVCFVDADLRRSKIHEQLDVLLPLGAVDQGLCGYLEGEIPYEEALCQSENENLALILAGGRAANPPRLLRSDRMTDLIERLQAEFDVVIIDAPPVLPVVDAAILSNLSRATLLVVRFGFTHQGDLGEAASRLLHVNAPLAGAVINGVYGAGIGYYDYGRYRHRYRYGASYSGYGGYGS